MSQELSRNLADIMRRGILDAVPIYLPAIPFALVLGIAMAESGLLPWLGWSTSPIIYGGASQLTLLSLLGEGTAAAAGISAALIVNARHLMYSAAMAPTFQRQPGWFRWVGPYFLVDQVFALSMLRINECPLAFRRYYLTIGITFWLLWLTTTALALVIGPQVPRGWGLDFAVPVLFTGLLVMAIDRWPKLAAALVAAVTTWLAGGLPHRSGLLLGALAGVLAGVLLDKSGR
jgi:predicted branched-subunit amino acid permease